MKEDRMPPHLEEFSKAAMHTHISARGAVELLYEREVKPLVAGCEGALSALEFGDYVDKDLAIQYLRDILAKYRTQKEQG